MLAMALVPLAIVSWRLITINRTSLLATQRAVQFDEAKSNARSVATYVDGYVDRTATFARALEVAGGLSNDPGLAGRLRNALVDDPNLVAVAFVPSGSLDGSGMSVSEIDVTRIVMQDHVKVPESDIVRLVRDGAAGATADGPFLGAAQVVGETAVPVVATSDVVNIDGRRLGHVVMVVDLTEAFPFLDTVRLPDPDGEVMAPDPASRFVVDERGGTLASSHSAAPGDPQEHPLVRDWLAQSGETGGITREFDQPSKGEAVRMLGSVASAELAGGQRIGIVSVVSRDVAMAPANRMTAQTIWASVIVAFVTVLVAILFAGYIANPIKELATGARAMANGDFSRRISVWSNNETGQLAVDFNRMADRLSSTVDEMRDAAVRNHELFIGTVRGLAAAIDGKDPYTRGHSERVAEFSSAMAIELGLPEDEVEKIRISGLMHDVGKLAIEDKILRKPAALTDEEFEIMREHPERGTRIMSEIPHMREYIPGMRFHHEMMNGKGYPLGLEGYQIPLMARIVSVADTFDAMTTNRPYQKQMPIDLVFERIRDMAGIRYDPEVVEALVRAYDNGRIRLRLKKSGAGLSQ